MAKPVELSSINFDMYTLTHVPSSVADSLPEGAIRVKLSALLARKIINDNTCLKGRVASLIVEYADPKENPALSLNDLFRLTDGARAK
ncbi:MAG TPA: hypothetical protein VLG76_00425 [Rhabdochlamydiaceae bacterium]|nr:hypothetical protein [Rhabdochlamydiaceae bacterium]